MQQEVQYREIEKDELTLELFSEFKRRQEVNLCWRREDGQWVIKEDPFIDDWSREDYQFLVQCLLGTIEKGGLVYGAFVNGKLKGFTSVEAEFLGKNKDFLDLTSIHVSQDMRGMGIGKKLFLTAADWARQHGAKRLYISSHSAAETQNFYRSLGCADTSEPIAEHVEREPYDCQLEYNLTEPKQS